MPIFKQDTLQLQSKAWIYPKHKEYKLNYEIMKYTKNQYRPS